MKPTILGTGLSGLIGTRVTSLLANEFTFADLSLTTGVDITNRSQVLEKVAATPCDLILHMAAKADVDGCEKDKDMGKDGAAWKINVVGTENILEAARQAHKKVLYISTDFVFDGIADFYTETDIPRPLNWYGLTKYEAEKRVLMDTNNLVVRIAYPYLARPDIRPDFLHAILAKLEKGEAISVVTDHIFTPTFVDEIAAALATLIKAQATGIYHVVGNTSLSPFEAAVVIADTFSKDKQLILASKREEFYRGRAPRPYKLALKNDKIRALGVHMSTFAEGVLTIKHQETTI